MDTEIKEIIEGDVLSDEQTLVSYSHDASLCEVKPQVVVFPKGSSDIQKIVRYAIQKKKTDPHVSLTARAAGTCMSGGSMNRTSP